VKEYERDAPVAIRELASVRALVVRAGTINRGEEFGIVAAAILLFAAKVTAAVRVAKFAVCTRIGLVSPDKVAVQGVLADRVLVAAVKTTVVLCVAWLLSAPANVVLPQPDVATVTVLPMKPGKASVTVSPCARAAVQVN
jgi:hypothetical protein